ncbi:MAG: hypothetical protein ACC631_09900, partial [Halocynthiibacter sp.]
AVLGLGLAVLGVFLFWTGLLRARVRLMQGGPGLVEIIERRMTYFSPGGGGSFSLNDVTRIEIETTGDGPEEEDMFWLFHLPDRTCARIPASAAEAEGIIDALTAFPGANYEFVVAASGSTESGLYLIWQKGD